MSVWESFRHRAQTEGADIALRELHAKASTLAPDDGLRVDFATALKEADHPSEALDILAPAIAEGDFHVRFRALIERGICLLLLGREAEATSALVEAQAMDPGSDWPLWPRVDAAIGAGQPALALSLIEHVYPNVRPDGRARLARRHSEIRAESSYADMQPGWAGLHVPGSVPALARAGLVMMVKDEADIVTANLEHHYRLGFRCFCLLDNNSTDGTAALVTAFRDAHPDALVLLVHDPIVGYYQSAKIAAFQRTLLDYAAIDGRALEWMFFIDADEFIAYAGDDDAGAVARFEAALGDPAVGMIVMQWVNSATANIMQTLPEGDEMLSVFVRRPAQLRPAVPKIALRCALGLDPAMGNHFVENFDHPLDTMHVLAEDGWYMLHAPLRSLEHVKKKVINGGRAFKASKGLENHGGHWRERYIAYETRGEDVLSEILQTHIDSCI
ncbi:hypothetical protein FHR90_000244 [Endobacter medicaginis]|uniref:Glycosyltransferase family 2 protein n=1 Tax=Endobacter medicaginis TaxID=1181271 RepID=A0A839UQH6_9PROT|nr:glycosyltransferase family 2 protein [Endobacter medicaginis]MBB3172438.1 hypothetical protein [Endobacter medicaginis]MCX5474073.1 glycosyltransferase family 2 protein [Endobacter medicaginis]NVN29502.1 glycosyltransferase family 2 protein [Endobacter medicaginis]